MLKSILSFRVSEELFSSLISFSNVFYLDDQILGTRNTDSTDANSVLCDNEEF